MVKFRKCINFGISRKKLRGYTLLPQSFENFRFNGSVEMSEPIENSHISFRSLPFPIILNFPTCSDSEKNLGGARNLAPDPGARNFRIFITPKKFTSFYGKDFLPKLIFLRKGVHHPKFRFSGVPRNFCTFANR